MCGFVGIVTTARDLGSAAVLAVGASYAEQPETALEVLRNFLAAAEPLDPLLDAAAQQP